MGIIKIKSLSQVKRFDGKFSSLPKPDLFHVVESELDSDDVPEGGILIQLLMLSVDPVLRLNLYTHENYENIQAKDKILVGWAAGKVLQSKNSSWEEGDYFGIRCEWSSHVILTAEQLKEAIIWNLTGYVDDTNIELGVNALGMTGITAYVGVHHVLKPKVGDTLFISAASGAVGSIAGQIAKIEGAKSVIGSAGGERKCEALKAKFGYDHAVDYKKCSNKESLSNSLKMLAPEGIDMYFENVGGMHFDAALENMNSFGRAAICGAIAGYNDQSELKLKFNPIDAIYKRLRIEGFAVFDYINGTLGNGEFVKVLGGWVKEGKLKYNDVIYDGMETFGKVFCSFFTGSEHTGKLSIRI